MKKKKAEGALTKIIFNESGQAKTLANEKLVEFFAVQKFDNLLAHQYCVRRFLLNHADYFNALRSIRNSIDDVLVETPLTNENRLFIGKRITAIARTMRMLDSRTIINLARKGKKKEIRESFESELHSAPSDKMFPILQYLDEDQILELVEIICNASPIVEDIHKDVNFLDYYDPFTLTNLINGKTMLQHYFSAKSRLYLVHHWALHLSSENHWLHTQEAELDDELTGIVCENGFLAKRPPSNVRIYGHNQHRIAINGVELEDHLILAVPTKETPINIDAALRDFRSALRTAFIDNVGFYANISKPEFDNSLFMKNFEERKFLVTDTNQYRGKMQGLWMWDVVHPAKTKNGLTTLDAIDEVTLEAEKQLHEIAPDEEPYKFDSYKNYYNHAVTQIGPELRKTRTPPKSRDLDRFITLSDVILGYRSR